MNALLKPAKKQNTSERRRSARTPHVAGAWIVSPTSTRIEDRIEVMAVNVSRHGVAFELNKPVPEATYFNMQISIGEQRIASEIRIIKCRKTPAGLYEVGAEFC